MRYNLITYISFIFLLAQASAKPDTSVANKIKHIVVLMEENRSFDHIFGWFKGVNGLTGKEYNLANASDPTSERVYVDDKARFVAPCDPGHDTVATTFKIFGNVNGTGPEAMSGFVDWEDQRGNAKTDHCMVMSSQSPSHLPILSALSSEFVLMDRFFCDFPGPTWPNRLFMLTATSAGDTETKTFYHGRKDALYPQLTFFDQLTAEGFTWRNYFNDTPWELFIESMALHPENLKSMEQFYKDAETGNLPSYSWINPRAAINITLLQGSNDQHPDHDMALGERYYKDIYEALRASPSWNDTLFIITYDEHGGFYDHVVPPTNVPPPDNETSYPDPGIKFNRLGMRIPTLLISPWLPKGSVVSGPPDPQKPFNNSEYTLTSIMATSRILLGMSSTPLTQRDAWAATFEHLFTNLTEPRTDCPLHLPAPPPPAWIFEEIPDSPEYVNFEGNLPLNGLQIDIMNMHATLAGVPFPEHIQRQGQVSEWLQAQFNAHAENTMQWKRSKTTRRHTLSLFHPSQFLQHPSPSISHPLPLPLLTSSLPTSWDIQKSASGFLLVSVQLPAGAMCLDYAGERKVGLSRCYPRENADSSLDKEQRWVWQGDTLRLWVDQSLCLAKDINTNTVVVKRCERGNKEQKWTYLDGTIQSFTGERLQVIMR